MHVDFDRAGPGGSRRILSGRLRGLFRCCPWWRGGIATGRFDRVVVDLVPISMLDEKHEFVDLLIVQRSAEGVAERRHAVRPVRVLQTVVNGVVDDRLAALDATCNGSSLRVDPFLVQRGIDTTKRGANASRAGNAWFGIPLTRRSVAWQAERDERGHAAFDRDFLLFFGLSLDAVVFVTEIEEEHCRKCHQPYDDDRRHPLNRSHSLDLLAFDRETCRGRSESAGAQPAYGYGTAWSGLKSCLVVGDPVLTSTSPVGSTVTGK